jgi:hypothetical protein
MPRSNTQIRRAFHIRASEIVKQHVELGSEQLAVSLLEVLLQLRLVRQNPIQTAVQARVVDLAVCDPQEVVQRRRWIPALFNRQFAAWRTQPVDCQKRRHTRPRHIGSTVIHRVLEEAIQFQAPPQFQPQIAGTELARPLQTNLVHQHASDLRIVCRRFDVGREQFQLLRFTLFIKDLNRSQPARLVGAVQFPQMTQCSLTRSIGCAHRFHQRPVGVLLAVLAPMIRPQKHSGLIVS